MARSWKDEEDQRALLRRIRELVTEEVRERGLADAEPAATRALAQRVAEAELRAAGVNAVQYQAMMREVLSYIGTGFGPLQPLFEDPATEEVMINRHDDVWVYRAGRHERRPEVRFRDDDEVVALVQRLVGQIGRQFNFANPIVDGRLPDGSRLNAILSGAVADRSGGVSARGTAVTIRRIVARPDFDALAAQGAIPTPEAAAYIERAVVAKRNLLVIGGMASGKTTYLNAFLGLVPQHERIAIAEDVLELDDPVPNTVRMEVRRANAEGTGGVSLSDLIHATMRIRPDRIIVGEVRSTEIGPMVTAMNIGHPGSMGTLHANGPKPALHRLEGLYRSATGFDDRLCRDTLASTLHLLIHVGFLDGGARRILEIASLDGYDEADEGYVVRPVFAWRGGVFVDTGYRPSWEAQVEGGAGAAG